MAVLKDLIVHGASRFLGDVYFNFLKANDIAAETGYFKKLTAIEGTITDLTSTNLVAKNATVTALLDVQGDMHTNSWSNSNIATIDGSFYITPTSVSTDGSDTSVSNYTPTGTIAYTSPNFTKISITGTFDTSQLVLDTNSHVPWPANSEVIITGDVLVGNEWLPLGTIRGKLENQVAATNESKIISIIPLSSTLTDGQGHNPVTLEAIRVGINLTSGTSSSLKMRKVKISLTSRANGSNQYPVGILLSAQGTGTGQTFIDIYGGNSLRNGQSGTINNATKYFTKPVVRIGNLEGLPKLANQTPSGWGIYTSNGFFEGAIVAKEGYIGDGETAWTIGSGSGTGSVSYIYAPTSGPKSKTAETVGMYIGTDGINNFKTTGQYVRIYDGKIYAQGAELSGNVAATQGFTVTSSVGGQTIASMTGSGISLGPITSTSYYNMLIDAYGIKLRYNTTVLNLIDSTGMTLKNSSGSTLAEFKSYINLGTGHTNTYTGSAAMGVGLTTAKANQIVVGRYNESNSNATFIIGDGTSSSDKSNLLTVGNLAGKQITDTFVGDGNTKTFTLSNTPTSTPTVIPDASSTTTYTISSWSDKTITLNTNVVENEQIQFQYTTNEKGGYLVIGNIGGVHGKGAIIGGSIYGSSTMTASGSGSSVHGYAYNSIMIASSFGASIHGCATTSTMTASGDGASIHGYATASSTMKVLGDGASIYGWATSSSTMTASGIGASIHGWATGGSTMTASGDGALIHGYAITSSTMTASSDGASIHGYATTSSTMTASGKGSSVYGYTYNSTMTASGHGSVALNEATHALARAQLAIGTYNKNDSTATTTHPSGTTAYGTYAFIIGNGTGDSASARSNALTVDWQGNVTAAGTLSAAHSSVTDISSSVTSVTTGTKVSAKIVTFGKVASLHICFKNTSSIAAGSDVFAATLASAYRPALDWATGGGYYGKAALQLAISSGGAITVRNAASAAITCSANTNVVATYILA